MRYKVEGPFEIGRKPNKLGVFDGTFWQNVPAEIRKACGCYVFAIEQAGDCIPWYVGKTERRTFERECFQPAKLNHYNEVLASQAGTPVLFLMGRRTATGRAYCRPTTDCYSDVEYLETMLIGAALQRNPELVNVQKTKLLRQIALTGLIKRPRLHRSLSDFKFMSCLAGGNAEAESKKATTERNTPAGIAPGAAGQSLTTRFQSAAMASAPL